MMIMIFMLEKRISNNNDDCDNQSWVMDGLRGKDDDFHAGETNINPDDAWTTTLPISMSERLFNWSRNQIVLFLHSGRCIYMNNHIIIKQV